MKSILPEYSLGMNLTGARVAKFKVSEKTNEIIYNAEGNVVTDGKNEDGSLKEGFTKENKPVNSEEVLNETNYQMAKIIMEKRLKDMGISEYNVKLNSNTGEIVAEIPENEQTDEAIASLTYVGKFEIKDSETNEILIDNKDVKHASAVYGSTQTGTTVFLKIEFNQEGTKKLEEMTKTYISTTDEEGNAVTKNISIEIDGDSMIKTYFGETISNGILQLSIGNVVTSNEELSTYIEQAARIASLIDNGIMKVQYELQENNYISAPIEKETIQAIVITIFAVLVIGFAYWIVRYHINGILAIISYLGLMATVLLVIRYANVTIALETIVSIISIMVANYAVLQYALNRFKKGKENKKEIIKQTYQHYASILCPLLIAGVVTTFFRWLPISSIGMVLFWGIAILAIYNYITMKILFDVQEVEK